jgi:phage baseplate assembly protein V
MLRYGTVSEIDPEKALVRVDFEEDAIVSFWLAVLVAKSKNDKYFHNPDVGDVVACMMDEHSENGIILGAIYTAKNKPQIQGEDKTAVVFKDGTEVEYDRENHKLRLKIVGDLTIVCDNDVNVECKNATVKADTKVKIDTPNAEFTGNIKVSGKADVTGNITGSGNIDANGTIQATGDVKAGGGLISLITHKHPTPVGPTGPSMP